MANPNNRPMSNREWSLLLFLSLLWGASFLFMAIAVQELPTLTVVLLRVGFAAATLHFVLIAIKKRMPSDRTVWISFLVMGLINNVVPFSLIVWGQIHIASGLASILNATTPLFTVVLAHFWTSDEKMTIGKVAGVLIGFVGVSVMIGPEALGKLGVNTASQLACLAAAASYAVAGIYGRRFFQQGHDPIVTATGQVTASTLMLIPIVAIVDQPWTLTPPNTHVWAAVLTLAVFSTALAYVVYFRILSTAGPTNLLLVTFLIPITAIVLGAIVLGERLEPIHLVGMALIGIGLSAIDGRLARHLLRKQ